MMTKFFMLFGIFLEIVLTCVTFNDPEILMRPMILTLHTILMILIITNLFCYESAEYTRLVNEQNHAAILQAATRRKLSMRVQPEPEQPKQRTKPTKSAWSIVKVNTVEKVEKVD